MSGSRSGRSLPQSSSVYPSDCSAIVAPVESGGAERSQHRADHPSIALFGILIGPMAWIGSHVPGASALGIAGIGAAPAFVALLLYSLLPMVANTVSGLAAVPKDLIDAARAMGMTDRQRLWQVELPLALPCILTAMRIVLVQNIGLATVAALIGGGGFGVFVFQGLGQNAADLILLGALPTVGLAFVAAVIMDALIAWSAPDGSRGGAA